MVVHGKVWIGRRNVKDLVLSKNDVMPTRRGIGISYRDVTTVQPVFGMAGCYTKFC
ncbi:hypothetical protein [Candidatus Hodgkinia cicadicola]|uniref:hypothetical protein n=1 Tax=Candidatus Hodgkinia cicadicola TaxID=573658 RepID=UPI001788B8C6